MSSAPDLTSRLVRHERLIVAAGVVLLAALAWLSLLNGAWMGDAMDMGMTSPSYGSLALMWWLMMVAMMLPSAAPAILLYARVREVRSRDQGIARTGVFLAGYLAIWALFSLAAALVQLWVAGPAMALTGRTAQAALLVAAGAYQLSPVKGACLRQCRSPAQFISRQWRPGWQGAIRLGVLHGAYCVGCCWLLMALLFVGGVMNFAWIAALTLIVAVEKLGPGGPWIGRALGLALIAFGAWILLA